MEILQERTSVATTDLEAQRHNAQIAERFKRLQNLKNAENEQFSSGVSASANTAVAESTRTVYTYETPVTETPVMQQIPQVAEYTRENVSNSVFTGERFDKFQQNVAELAATVVQPTFIAPTVEKKTETAQQTGVAEYSLSTFAKIVMAVFAAVVIAMITLICANSALINQKSIELRALEVQKAQLVQEYEALCQEIEAEISEESIRQYALENGMELVFGN